MIISRGRRYIFVHIPKTGGTAMALALEARAMADDILIGDTPKARRRRHRLRGAEAAGRLWKHSRLADVLGLVTPEEVAQMCVFTLVRNPWDRAVSYYHWLKAQGFDHPAVALAARLDFLDFLAHPQTRAAFAAETFGSYVTLPGQGEVAAHFVRLERLAQDIAPVASHLGFPLSTLPRANASARLPDYRRYYTDAAAEVVARACATDIARFGYSF